ncbi:MAG: hypothetical protein KKA60_08445 [Proteobacteria bacterium]|nr:hypothetical protein [Pseudomonadota bacterium]
MTENNDPFWKMKLALLKDQLAHPDPSAARFKAFFTEEFGQPPPVEFVDVFEKHLKKRMGNTGPRKAPEGKAPTAPPPKAETPPARQVPSRPPQPPPKPAASASRQVNAPVRPTGPSPKPVRLTAADDETEAGSRALLPAKLAILKKVLAHPNPSLQVLEQAFEEELGFRLSADVKTVFFREMRKRRGELDERDG